MQRAPLEAITLTQEFKYSASDFEIHGRRATRTLDVADFTNNARFVMVYHGLGGDFPWIPLPQTRYSGEDTITQSFTFRAWLLEITVTSNNQLSRIKLPQGYLRVVIVQQPTERA